MLIDDCFLSVLVAHAGDLLLLPYPTVGGPEGK